MSLVHVSSSSLCAVGCDGHNLAAVFHSSNTVDIHCGVPCAAHAALMRASFKGFNANTSVR
jgi:hypothetical protein